MNKIYYQANNMYLTSSGWKDTRTGQERVSDTEINEMREEEEREKEESEKKEQ